MQNPVTIFMLAIPVDKARKEKLLMMSYNIGTLKKHYKYKSLCGSTIVVPRYSQVEITKIETGTSYTTIEGETGVVDCPVYVASFNNIHFEVDRSDFEYLL